MTDQFRMIQEYDKLEALHSSGADPSRVEDSEMAKNLEVLRLLSQTAECPPMPRALEFRRLVINRVSRKRRGWVRGALGVAATVLLAVWLFDPRPPREQTLYMDPLMLDRAFTSDTRSAMLEYLEATERLLVSIRDVEMTCTENEMDIEPEKELARELLLKQKVLAPSMRRPEFWQAQGLFEQIEHILVDLNSLDLCTDPTEVDIINDHVSSEQLLGKIRLIAQDIDVS